MESIPYADFPSSSANVKFKVSNIPIYILSTIVVSKRLLLYRIDKDFNTGNIVNNIVSALRTEIKMENINVSLDLDLASSTFLIYPGTRCCTYNNKTNRQATSTIGEAFYMKQGNVAISWNRGVCALELTINIKYILCNNSIHSFSQTLLSADIIDSDITLNRYVIRNKR